MNKPQTTKQKARRAKKDMKIVALAQGASKKKARTYGKAAKASMLGKNAKAKRLVSKAQSYKK